MGLRERPLTENRELSELAHTRKNVVVFSVKNNKETYTYFKDYTDTKRKNSVAPNLELTK